MIVLHIAQFLAYTVHPLPIAAAQAGPDLTTMLNGLVGSIENLARTVGLAVFLVCVIIAGIMRMVAFGSERRIHLSNMALTAAVAGLVIMLLAAAFQTFVQNNLK
jgi:hypothetical protein